MSCPSRLEWPYSIYVNLVAKIFALLHDPPYKPIIVTGLVSRNELRHHLGIDRLSLEKLANRYFPPLSPPRSSIKDIHVHELAAAHYMLHVLKTSNTLRRIIKVSAPLEIWKKVVRFEVDGNRRSRRRKIKLMGLVSLADGLAASFDRYVSGMADNIYKSIHTGEYLTAGISMGLFNIFNPKLVLYFARERRNILQVLKHEHAALYDVIEYCAQLASHTSATPASYLYLRRFYHCLYVLLEPYLHTKLNDHNVLVTPLPADTRVPTHSIFDHLYATATAVNITSLSINVCGRDRDSYNTARPRGILVYVGLGGLWEWLSGSRKLSDLWVASWLATSLVWYAVRELVWCLGPDTLLLPDARWNHYYLSLLEEKLWSGYEDGYLGLLRDYYMYHGVPVYAWHPASVVLVLPVLSDKQLDENDECVETLRKLKDASSDDAEPHTARKIVNYLVDRLREGWRRIIESIMDSLEDARLNAQVFKRHLELVIDKPPFTPIVAAVAFGGKTNSPIKFWSVYARCQEIGCQVEESAAIEFDKLLKEYNLSCIADCQHCKRRGNFKCYHVAKMTYVLATHLLMTLAARLHSETYPRYWLHPYMEPGEEGVWRHCTSCRTGIATFRVPGREVGRGNPDEEYRNWAASVWRPRGVEAGEAVKERAWRVLYPVFRPGERLCPYCLVKRLAGLPTIFANVAEALHGSKPRREVQFPSTSDIAWLSGKLAMLKAAKLALEDENNAEPLRRALTEVAKVLKEVRVVHRSSRLVEILEALERDEDAESLRGKIRRLVEDFFWTPRLLYEAAWRVADRLKQSNSVDRDLLRGVLAVLALAWMETRDIIELYPEVRKVLTEVLPRGLQEYAERLRDVDSGRAREALEAARALSRTRNYYAVIAFNASSVARLLEGLVPAKNSHPFRAYLDALIDSHFYVLRRSPPRIRKKAGKSIAFLRRYFELLGGVNAACKAGLKQDDLLVAGEELGAVPVSPSYHRALANSLAYTLLRLAVVAERLGGIPIYMGGDEGLVLLPGWLPPSLNPYYQRYTAEALRALSEKTGLKQKEIGGIRGERLLAWSPPLLYLTLLNRILWGSSSRRPGFHPVKRGGRGGTIWYIPALAATGLRAGLVVAHYRDHLHAVIEEAITLVDSARGKEPLVAVYWGRLEPTGSRSPIASIRLADATPTLDMGREDLEKLLRSAGWLPALTGLINGLIEEGLLSRNMPYDIALLVPGGMGATLRLASRSGIVAQSIARLLLERNASDKRIVEELMAVLERLEWNGELLDEVTKLLLAARAAAR